MLNPFVARIIIRAQVFIRRVLLLQLVAWMITVASHISWGVTALWALVIAVALEILWWFGSWCSIYYWARRWGSTWTDAYEAITLHGVFKESGHEEWTPEEFRRFMTTRRAVTRLFDAMMSSVTKKR